MHLKEISRFFLITLLGWVGCGLVLLAACTRAATPAPLPSLTPAPLTPTFTPTIVWFPPTATFTPFPTPLPPEPTPDLRPGIGDILLRDDFTDPATWTAITEAGGSVAFGKAELTIATEGGEMYLFGIREQPDFGDYYLEITASVSFCSEKDEYGLLLRVSPELEAYRFSLSCDGYVRMDRLYRGQASSPIPWTLSGAVAAGAPNRARLSVWAVGPEMRFFVNDIYQFTVRDPLLISGGVGVFARSANDMPLTVNFTDLVIYEISGIP
ncbi:MAG: hypothetical protein JW726_06835 [Anaerolineales bacterium]|nr:hypothetical protein [Anaerolineales bacterium]